MRQYLSAHIETNNTDYGHTSTNHVRLPGLEGWEIDSRLLGPDTLRLPNTTRVVFESIRYNIQYQTLLWATYFVDYANSCQVSLQLKNPPCAWTYWEVSVGCYSGDPYCKDYVCMLLWFAFVKSVKVCDKSAARIRRFCDLPTTENDVISEKET